MSLTIEIEVQDCDGSDINITNQCENLTLEIIDAPMGGDVSISKAAGNKLERKPDGLYVRDNAFTRTAGTAISALVAVYELPDGTVWPLSADDDDHIDLLAGITLTSASTGAEVDIQRAGPLDAAGLNLQQGRVWLGMNGQLTQTPPDTGNDTLLGYATAEQRLYIDISETILLED